MNIETNSEQNLLCRLEEISSAAGECRLDFGSLEGIDVHLAEISGFLGITNIQAIFFGCITELSFHKSVTLDALAKHIKCSVLKLVTFMGEIEALEKKNYIRKAVRKKGRTYSYNDVGYTVPYNIIEALRQKDSSMLLSATKFDLPGFLRQVSDIIDERLERTLTTEEVFREVEFLISNNLNLPYVDFINEALTKSASKCSAYAISYTRLKGQFNVSIDRFADALFDDLSEQLEFSQAVSAGSHELISRNILNLVSSEFDGEKCFAVSDPAAKKLYVDYPALLIVDQKTPGVISYKSIPEKRLYFNNGIGRQIGEIEEVLRPGRFKAYCRALGRNNLTKGITSIFFGAPGTGKTESVYQIARKTGRDIMMVDLSQTKSKWFGESEKRVKQIFDDYSALRKNSIEDPVLFINEADGLFTRRSEVTGSTTSADQAINTMQNILLQALESFEGIFIATTNLTCNLDKAFERRFSFRVEFPKPDVKSRQRIWKSKVPELSDKEASMLAEKFELTGGDIDIQVRQALLRKVLKRREKLYDILEENCKKDHGFAGRKKIGY